MTISCTTPACFSTFYRIAMVPTLVENSMYLYMYACLKMLITDQQLVTFGYDEWTNPRDITEDFGYASLMF